MSRRVLVAGAGIAGLAAAFRARALGCDVTVVSSHPGASALGGGAVDDLPWEQLVRAARALDRALEPRKLEPLVLEFTQALGAWDLPKDSLSRLATTAGRIRPARGRDRALLDIALLAGKEVLLPRVDRASWDADALAVALSEDAFARARQIRFIAVDLPILRFEEEYRIPDGDLASRHDDDVRLRWLAARLCEGLDRRRQAGAVLLGPWLGAAAARAEALSDAVGVPVGEALVGVGSAAGLRFEAARDRLLNEVGARVVRARVERLTVDAGKVTVSLGQGHAPLVVDAAVLAVGGIAGGGLVYTPPENEASADLPPGGRVPFALSLRADVTLVSQSGPALPTLMSAEMGVTSSLHGPELDLIAWPREGKQGALEAVGVRCDGVRVAPFVTAAGDVIAGRPRTVLEAVSSGLRAGSASAGVSVER